MSSKQRGSIYKRGDGRWCAALRLEDGRRKTFYGWKQREVQDKLDAAKASIKAGTFAKGRSPLLVQFLAAWLRDSVKPSVAPATYRSYAGLTENHIAPALGSVTLERLTPQHVQQLLNASSASGSSSQTVWHIRAVLRAALNQAVKWQLVSRNVASMAKPPRVKRYEHRAFAPDEARRFLAAIRGDRLEALYVTAVSTGLRQGELLGLQWSDLDLDKGFVTVRQQLQRIDGRLSLVELKSESSRRTVMLTADTVLALRDRQAGQRVEKLAQRKRWKETGLVFTTPIGTPLEGPNVTKGFQKLLRSAKLPERRFHDLRHSTATLLLVQGVSPKVVQAILGHSSIRLTMDTYSHVVPELQRDAAEKMQAVLQR